MEILPKNISDAIKSSNINKTYSSLTANNTLALIMAICGFKTLKTHDNDVVKNISRAILYHSFVHSINLKKDIDINKKKVDALSQILHKENSDKKARELIDNLKELIPRQMFEISIQGCIGAKVLASTSVRGFRKDVTAKLYGGDATRKMKLLKKQKEGKKKMKKIGNVEIPKEAFYEFMMPKK